MIKEREEHNSHEKTKKKAIGSGTESAEMSFKIRACLKEIREQVTQLDNHLKKAERKIKGKNKPELKEILDSRREIVKLCYSHLEELENLDKARFNEQMAEDRVTLFTGPSAPQDYSKIQTPNNQNTPELPDIEVQEDLALIRQRGQDLDRELDEIAAGVSVIKQIAIQMGEEVDKQNEMLTELDTKVDKVQDHMETVNDKMKTALEGIMKGDKFIVNCILICVLLGLLAYLASILIP